MQRIQRIGQKRPTTVEILVAEGSLEEDIFTKNHSARSSQDETHYWRQFVEVGYMVLCQY